MKTLNEIHTEDMQETRTLMILSEITMRSFLDEEPDLYSISDAKVVLSG